ncbi:MAG: allantoinase AllB [Acidobacteria bacterium]|jgi:allantoinase|nr:allantoinase AllB [Acidobacteriota bacterium]
MDKPDLIIRSRRVVTPKTVSPASVHIRDGIIAALGEWDEVPAQTPLVDVGDAVVMPGLVDAHVHVNEPGRTEWEGFATATRAAAAGGVTTLVDMPLNSIPPTTTLDGFAAKLAAARGQCLIDVAFWGGVIPGNTHELKPLLNAGVRGFKCFLIHSGVDEFPHVTESNLLEAMPELAALGSVLLVHAEVPEPIENAAEELKDSNPQDYQTFLKSRPRASENEAVALMVRLCRETGARVHIVHHSSADALPLLKAAKAEGLPLTVETCPHYLTFAAEEIPDGATHFKCCPPVRERENRERLWDALAESIIDMVVSDHSPCTPNLKLTETGDFLEAWGGIATLQFSLPVMWTQLQKRGFGLHELTRWMSAAPAKLAGLDKRKGRLAVGCDADIVIFQPEKEFKVVPEIIEFKNKLTPYAGMNLRGVVETAYVRGTKIYESGQFPANPIGVLLIK